MTMLQNYFIHRKTKGTNEYWCGADEPEDDPPEWFYVTFEDADDPSEYEDPPVWMCEDYPDD